MRAFSEAFHIYCGPHEYPGARDTLYRNNGDGTFTDVTTRAGVRNTGKGLGVLLTDTNNDGYPDIFVANDAVPDFPLPEQQRWNVHRCRYHRRGCL